MNEGDEKIHRDSLARDLCPMGFEDQEAFMIGARWQREALLSDEAVERAARGIQASHDRGDWDEELPVVQDEYRDLARAALTAAMGEDEK